MTACASPKPFTAPATALWFAAAGSVSAQVAAPAADLGDAVMLPSVEVQAQRNRAVSSPKFTAPLVDTPQTVSVIPKEIFNQQGAASLADVLGNTPGITFLAGEGGHVSGSNSFFMRGFDTSGNIFIDGVRDNGNYGRDVYNLDQVEVVKGPAGDNGRGTASGYINLATKAPQADSFGQATASVGFDGHATEPRHRATIDVNQTLAAGAAVRLNALWQDGGVAGREHAQKNSWGVAPSLALGLGTPTRLTLSYQHDEQDDRPDYGHIGGIVDGTATAVRPLGPVPRENFFGHASDFDRVDIDVASARLEHDLSPTMRLSTVARYSTNDRHGIYTVPSALDNRPDMNTGQVVELVTTTRQAFAREVKTLSSQTNLASQFSTGRFDHSVAGGLEFVRERGRTLRDWTGLGTLGDITKVVNVSTAGAPIAPTTVIGTSPYAPNLSRAISGFAPAYRFEDEIEVDTAALYVFDTIRFSDHWQATGGARLERYKATYEVLDRTTGIVTPFEASDSLVTGKLGLVFKPAANGSVYVSWGLAAQPPGTNNLSNDNGSRSNGTPGTTGQNSPNAKPQESVNYELGVKWDFFSRRLSTSLALFRSERTNISVATDTSGVPSAYGDQMVQGLEAGVSGRVTANWVVFGGLTLLDSENRNPANAVQNGSELNWTPQASGNLWTTYRLPIGLTVGGGAQYSGKSRVSLNNTSAATLPSHWVFNAMAAYEVSDRFSLRLNVTNVTDELYARALNNNSNRTYLGEPRTYLVSAELKF